MRGLPLEQNAWRRSVFMFSDERRDRQLAVVRNGNEDMQGIDGDSDKRRKLR